MNRLVKYTFFLFILYGWFNYGAGYRVIVVSAFLFSYGYYVLNKRWPWDGRLASLGGGGDTKIIVSKPKITFADVAGIDEAKEELLEIVDFLKNPEKFTRVGGRLPRGAIMTGPPGVGKTLCAKAIAGEAGVPFIEMAGSSFVNRYVGVGAENIRQLFDRAKAKSPSIVFIDEFDSLGKRIEEGSGGDHEYNQTINQLLVEMDGFSSDHKIIILAATNRIDKIDEAFLRPGRFDRKIYIHRPDINGREAILKVHAKNKPLAKDVDLGYVARITSGFSGADLENLLNEAAIAAGKLEKTEISLAEINTARDRVILGKEKKSMIIDPEEKRITAFHESGHAILAAILENCDPPDKVTIIPRDMALGVTSLSPGKDRYNVSKKYLEDQMVMLLGGRVAEVIGCGVETAGAKNDIERATQIAHAMTCEYGMNKLLGPVAVNVLRGQRVIPSSMEQDEVHFEIQRLIKEMYRKAESLLSERVDILNNMAEVLIQKEVINGEDVANIIDKFKRP